MSNKVAPISTMYENEIWTYLKSGELVISPLLDIKQVGRASVDVRLGNEFIVIRQTQLSGLDVQSFRELPKQIRQYQEGIRIGYAEGFVLHPQQFVLGSTLEYFSFPLDLTAYVIGRSSWGRLGLVIATATFVDPGFKGVITLELANLGDVPITLYPGVRIAQLVFHKLAKKAQPYTGRYSVTVGPKFSGVYLDNELPWIIPKED